MDKHVQLVQRTHFLQHGALLWQQQGTVPPVPQATLLGALLVRQHVLE